MGDLCPSVSSSGHTKLCFALFSRLHQCSRGLLFKKICPSCDNQHTPVIRNTPGPVLCCRSPVNALTSEHLHPGLRAPELTGPTGAARHGVASHEVLSPVRLWAAYVIWTRILMSGFSLPMVPDKTQLVARRRKNKRPELLTAATKVNQLMLHRRWRRIWPTPVGSAGVE